MTNKDEIKDRVLTENTAQGILNHLRDLASNRARMQRRWIWELLQNARDTSAGESAHLIASIELADGELIFQHNGRGFTMEEVAHLIYHGSTKLEDEETIGQYGSGFLTTHLLSPQIDVSGQLDDGRPFDFCLKREISSAKALSESMDRAWEEFDTSGEEVSGDFTTRFRYPIEADSTDAVREGIETLRRCAPFVVVFNSQFRRIVVKAANEVTSFEVVERTHLEEKGLQTVTVLASYGGIRREEKYVLAESEKVSVTIPLEPTKDGFACRPLNDIPKLFLGFPLIGTESFSFPAVINSLSFTPTENRDGVYLGQSNDVTNQTNQAVIEEACKLHVKLMQFAAKSSWMNTFTLANIPPISGESWLNSTWIKEQHQEFVEHVRQTPAILCGHDPTVPKDSILPFAEENESVENLWDLLNQVKSLREKLPRRDEAVGWRDAVESWAAITGFQPSSFPEALDGSKLASYIEVSTKGEDPNAVFGTIDNLQDLLNEDVSAIEWLNRLYACLKSAGLDNVIQERHFVLDQAGWLDKLSNLHRDKQIDDELKEVADDLLELGLRGKLRDTRLTSIADEIGKGDYENEDVTREIIKEIRDLFDKGVLEDGPAQANARLFAWIVRKKEWDKLVGFPTFSVRPDDGSRPVLWLGQKGVDEAELPLAPIRAWPEDLQQYADLFPWRFIMADAFFDLVSEQNAWQMLHERGLVRNDVVLNSERNLAEFLPDEPLAQGEHKTVDTIKVSDLVFLSRDSVGVMARVRDSQDRARLFWRFLTEWLTVRNIEGLELSDAMCECGEIHRYYPAIWLGPLVRNKWIPQGNNVREPATAQSLAVLLRGSGWTPSSLAEQSATVKLLAAIRVTRLDLMREFVVNDDESRIALDDTMVSILASTGGDLRYVREFVEDMQTDDGLPEYLADRRERRRLVHENQHLGEHVENLVKESLEGEGFTVRRTGIGSDFEIEYDLIEKDEEIGIELYRNNRKWLVEVKATRDQRVRMTSKQAETAVTWGVGFLLCVVPVGPNKTSLAKDDVRASMRFVQNIGPRVEPLCKGLNALNDLRDEATATSDSDIALEIQSGTARIRVDNTVWHNGIHLEELLSQLK